VTTADSQPEERWLTSRRTALRTLGWDGPDGAPAVVVLHGLTVGTDVLRSAVPGRDPYQRLAAEGLHVLALDWPGHGRSGGQRGRLTYRLAMDSVAAAVEAARTRWRAPVGVLGMGLGGVLGFYAGLEEDGIGAVVCNGVLDLRNVRPALHRARQGALLPTAGLLRRLLPAAAHAAIPLPAGAVVAGVDLAGDAMVRRAIRQHPQRVSSYDLDGLGSIMLAGEEKPDIAAARSPTLIAVGSNDRAMPETAARHFASRLTCEHELWVLPGGSHQLLLEHGDAFAPVAARFLHRHLGERPGHASRPPPR
jgi:alpha-beta hydrolase superfamily lysophospholipase